MSARCPSDLGLEGYLVGASPPVVKEHVSACSGCARRLARMEQQGEYFHAVVYPATVDSILDSVAPRRSRWRDRHWRVGLGLTAAAAAALVLTVGGGSEDRQLGVRVYTGDTPEAQLLVSGARVQAGTTLSVRVVPPDDCHLWLASVDERGAVVRLHPPQGDQGTLLECHEENPVSATLGGRTGLERLFAVCGGADLTWGAVAEAVRRSAAGNGASVRSAGTLQGLPEGTVQSTLLLEAVP